MSAHAITVRNHLIPTLWDGFAQSMPLLARPVLMQLFLTPVRRVPRRPNQGTVLGHVSARGRQVCVRASGQGPTVALVHGWQGYAGQFDVLREELVSRGYRVVFFDMPAHGETGGRTSSIVEFCYVLQRVAEIAGPLHAVVGHSLGATATSLALRRGMRVGGAALLSPLVSFDFALDEFARVLKLGDRAKELAARSTERKVGVARADLDLFGFDRPTQRLFLYHDRDDKRTRYEDSATLARTWECALVESRGLGHTRFLRDAGIVTKICEFVESIPTGISK